MEAEELKEIADKLANGEIDEYRVIKENVINFSAIIRKRPDFKHFKGTAFKGGEVVYQYLEEPRS